MQATSILMSKEINSPELDTLDRPMSIQSGEGYSSRDSVQLMTMSVLPPQPLPQHMAQKTTPPTPNLKTTSPMVRLYTVSECFKLQSWFPHQVHVLTFSRTPKATSTICKQHWQYFDSACFLWVHFAKESFFDHAGSLFCYIGSVFFTSICILLVHFAEEKCFVDASFSFHFTGLIFFHWYLHPASPFC